MLSKSLKAIYKCSKHAPHLPTARFCKDALLARVATVVYAQAKEGQHTSLFPGQFSTTSHQNPTQLGAAVKFSQAQWPSTVLLGVGLVSACTGGTLALSEGEEAPSIAGPVVPAAVHQAGGQQPGDVVSELSDEERRERRKLRVLSYVEKRLQTQKNAPIIPDVIEKEIYVGVLMMALDLMNSVFTSLEGTEVLGYSLEVHMLDAPMPLSGDQSTGPLPDFTPVVDALLADEDINIDLLPDFIERQIYLNALVLLYGLLWSVAESATIDSLGMALRLHLGPSSRCWEQASQMKDSFEVDPVVLDRQMELLKDEIGTGPFSYLKMKLYKDLYVFLMCLCGTILETSVITMFDTNFEMRLGVLEDLPSMHGLKRTAAKDDTTEKLQNLFDGERKKKIQAELVKLRKEEDAVKHRVKARLAGIENRKKQIKRELRSLP